MIFKCGPIELICSFIINFAELLYKEIEIEIHNNQIIANYFNGINNLRFRNVFNLLFVFFEFFFSPFLWLGLTKARSYKFRFDFLSKCIKNYFVKCQ